VYVSKVGRFAGVAANPLDVAVAAAPKDRYWVKDWRLYLPHPEQEMASWLTSQT
jgi:hypothetical protein